MKKLRVLVLMHEEQVPPEQIDHLSDKEISRWKTEYDVLAALEELEHETRPLGVTDNLGAIRECIQDWRPHIVFNLLEEFSGLGTYVPYVLGYLELRRMPYTGCNPRGLILTDNKTLMRKILRHHRIPMPEFFSVPVGRTCRRPKRIGFPLIVKSSTEHGSVGIAQASIVHDDDKLSQRVQYVHEHLGSDAIIEEFIEGRELYIGILGHRRLQTLPIWELSFENLTEGAPRIATSRVKWDLNYQEKTGVRSEAAKDLSDHDRDRITRLCKRVYRILELSAYARLDLRMTPEGRLYLLEPNPNPDIAHDEEFGDSALTAGIEYNDLIRRILSLGFSYQPGWKKT